MKQATQPHRHSTVVATTETAYKVSQAASVAATKHSAGQLCGSCQAGRRFSIGVAVMVCANFVFVPGSAHGFRCNGFVVSCSLF